MLSLLMLIGCGTGHVEEARAGVRAALEQRDPAQAYATYQSAVSGLRPWQGPEPLQQMLAEELALHWDGVSRDAVERLEEAETSGPGFLVVLAMQARKADPAFMERAAALSDDIQAIQVRRARGEEVALKESLAGKHVQVVAKASASCALEALEDRLAEGIDWVVRRDDIPDELLTEAAQAVTVRVTDQEVRYEAPVLSGPFEAAGEFDLPVRSTLTVTWRHPAGTQVWTATAAYVVDEEYRNVAEGLRAVTKQRPRIEQELCEGIAASIAAGPGAAP